MYTIRGAQGTSGVVGDRGAQGPTGAPGADGQDGTVDGFDVSVSSSSCGGKGHVALIPNINVVGTDADVVIGPRGTGSLSVRVPDSTKAGGNCRGDKAVDLQMGRTFADEVASGTMSAIAGGTGNKAGGDYSAVIAGSRNDSSGNYSVIAAGTNNTIASGCTHSFISGGYNHTISSTSTHSAIIGGSSSSNYINSSAVHSVVIGEGPFSGGTCTYDRAVVIGGGSSKANDSTYIGTYLFLHDVSSSGGSADLLIWNSGTQEWVYRNESSVISDERLKQDIEILVYDDQNYFDPEKLQEIDLISYFRINDDGTKVFGFSAQNLQETIPHVITTGRKGYLRYSPLGVIQYLTSVLAQKEDDMDLLRSNINLLKNKINEKNKINNEKQIDEKTNR